MIVKRTSLSRYATLAVLAAFALPPASADPPVPRVIYSTFAASATADVPGVAGAYFRWFDRPACDPNGTWIVLSADIDGDPNVNQVVIVRGTGALATGTLRLREGDAIPGTSPALHNGPIRGPLAIRPDGSFAYVTNLPASDFTDPEPYPDVYRDDVLVRYDGTGETFAIVIREGDAVPGTVWPPERPERIGTYLDSMHVLENNVVAYTAGATWGLTDQNEPNFAAMDEFVIKGGQMQLRAGVSFPSGYDVDKGGETERVWDHFDVDKHLLTPDGAAYLLRGDLTGDADYNDNVVAYGGEVVLQQRRILGPTPSPGDPNSYRVQNIKAIDLSPDGHWMAYGKYSFPYQGDYREYEYLVRDGERVAMTGELLPCSVAGLEKLRDADWNETFFLLASNSTGEYLYGAFTGPSQPGEVDPNDQSDVLVWVSGASKRPVLRSGLRADIDGDGVANPAVDPLILSFKESSACLTADRVIFAVVELELPSGALGEGLIRFRLCAGDADGDGDTDQDDIDIVLFALGSPVEQPCPALGDLDGDGEIDQDDIDIALFEFGNCGQD